MLPILFWALSRGSRGSAREVLTATTQCVDTWRTERIDEEGDGSKEIETISPPHVLNIYKYTFRKVTIWCEKR